MFMLSLILMPDGSRTKMLFDVETTLPLFYPLRYSIDHLNNRSASSPVSYTHLTLPTTPYV